MVMTRSRRIRKKLYKSKRTRGRPTNFKKYRSMRVSKYNLNVRYFKRKCKVGSITTNTGGYVGGSIVFRLDSLPGYTEFTSLFDQYCIRYVKLYFVSRGVNLSIIESINNQAMGMPNIITVRDYDDNTAPSSDEAGYNTLREYSKSKTFSFTTDNRVFTIGIVPSILSENYRTGVTTAYSPKFKQYLDCSYPDVPHYSIKYCINIPNNGSLSTPQASFDVYATYYLSFKTIR